MQLDVLLFSIFYYFFQFLHFLLLQLRFFYNARVTISQTKGVSFWTIEQMYGVGY